MAKTETPFFGLGAQGSVGGSITAQKRGPTTLLRKKPLPTDPYSLPQAYQRWLYQDYAYLWTQQSQATQALYRASGSRRHLTGFQMWMKLMLATIPDIVGWWRFDYQSGGITPDSSKKGNNATLVQALISPGWIDHSVFMDGIDDKVNCGNDPSLTVEQITIEALIYPTKLDNRRIACKATQDPIGGTFWEYSLFIQAAAFNFEATISGVYKTLVGGTPLVDTLQHVAATYDGSYLRIVHNGALVATSPLTPGIISPYTQPLYIGYRPPAIQTNEGYIDNLIIYNRALDLTELKRHSERRYPS